MLLLLLCLIYNFLKFIFLELIILVLEMKVKGLNFVLRVVLIILIMLVNKFINYRNKLSLYFKFNEKR